MANRRLEVVITGDSRSLERAFGKAGASGSKFGDRIGRVAKASAVALAGAGVGAIGLGAKLVQLAGDAGEVESKFRTVFGREMPRMTKELDRFSAATGSSRYQLRQQTADLGALLVPLTGTVKAAADMSVGFTKLATDLSSFNNVPVEEALLAIRAGLVGEAEPLRRFGVLLNEAAVKAEAYRSGIAKAGSELTEQQKVQARANLIMQQTKLAQGDATRTADSFTNQLRRLKNMAVDTGTDIGMKLVPHVTTALEKLNEWGPALANRVRPQLERLGDWVREHEQEFRDLFRDTKETASDLAAVLERVATGADTVAKKMGGWDDAFQLVLSGVLAAKFAGVLTRLSGKDGKGGIAGALGRIKAMGPTIAITLAITLALNKDQFEKGIGRLNTWINQHPALRSALTTMGLWNEVQGHGARVDAATKTPQGTVADPRGATVGSAAVGAGSVTVNPRRAPAGTGAARIKNHVITFVKRISAAYGSSLTIWDNSTHNKFVAGTNNTVVSQHWAGNAADIPMSGAALTRLGQTALVVAGASPDWAFRQTGGAFNVNGVNILFNTNIGGNHFNHLHVGLTSLPPGVGGGGDRTVTGRDDATAGGGGGGGGGDRGGGGGGAGAGKAKPPLIPAKLREAVARAEGTKQLGDDLTALGAVATYLQKILPKTKDVEKRIEITEALNSVRGRIRDILEQRAEAKEKIDLAKAVAWEKLQDRFRQAIERATDKVAGARGAFSDAFSAVADRLYRVFDAKTDKLLADARVKVMGFEIGAGEETPAERELRQRREKRASDDLQRALQSAETEEERQAALAAIEEAALEQRAQTERKAADEALAAEQRRIQDERAEKRLGFAQELADLEERWATANVTAEQRTKELQDLLKKHELPFNEVGSLIGTAFADGFTAALQVVFNTLDELERRIAEAQGLAMGGAGGINAYEALRKRSEALNERYGLPAPPGQNLTATFVGVLDGQTVWESTQKYALRDMARNGTTGIA